MWNHVNLVRLSHDETSARAIVNTVMNLGIP
jgi:hypothetical protein